MAAASGAIVAAAAAHAALVQASNASGLIVRVSPEEFQRILARATEEPLIVQDKVDGGLFTSEKYQYMMSYKGLAFVTTSETMLALPENAEIVLAEKMWVPI